MAPTGSTAARSLRERCPLFQVQKLLGQGTFGKVYLVRESSTGRLKAVKRTQKWKRTASREVLCLEESRGSKGLVAADSIFYTTTPGGFTVQNIVMDYMGSSLQNFLTKQRKNRNADIQRPNSTPWIRQVASQIIHGVYELHSRGVLHRDLKPENVLVHWATHTFHGDFAITFVRQIEESSDGRITARICDMALGCLLAELICLRPLFECDGPAPSQANVPALEGNCAAEAFQLLTIVELLGSPSKQAVNNLCTGCQPATRKLAVAALGRFDGVEPLDLEQVLLSMCPANDGSLVQIITSLLRWRPDDRVNASVLLQHPYIRECPQGLTL